jgi:hypothetical protein
VPINPIIRTRSRYFRHAYPPTRDNTIQNQASCDTVIKIFRLRYYHHYRHRHRASCSGDTDSYSWGARFESRPGLKLSREVSRSSQSSRQIPWYYLDYAKTAPIQIQFKSPFIYHPSIPLYIQYSSYWKRRRINHKKIIQTMIIFLSFIFEWNATIYQLTHSQFTVHNWVYWSYNV